MNEEKVTGTEKEFLDVFRQLCISRSSWQVWADLMAAMACTLANAVDKSLSRHTAREKEYAECIKRLGGVEKPAKCFAIVVEALERNPDQDFLGRLYMSLELGNHWKGQFFTPYDVCRCMAELTIHDNMQKLQNKEWVSVNDPACGAGATLIAAANTFRRKGFNYQTQVLFVANDIDRVTAQMCFIQLSLLGCPGYVAVANTLSNPVAGNTLMPEERPEQEFWYTPFYFRPEWNMRRQLQILRHRQRRPTLFGRAPEQITFHFDFEKRRIQMSEQLKQEVDTAEIDRLETETDVDSKTIGQDEAELPESKLEDESGNESSAEAETTENTKSIKQKAKEKLEAEKKKATQKNFADPIIAYLLKRCEEDQGLAEDVMQEGKTWNKCFNYIVEQARKQSNGRSTAVEDRVVYEWAEDYYRKYEKPETAKKEKGKKPATTKKTEAPAKKVTEIKKDIQETKDDSKVSEKPEKKDAASKQQKTEKTSTKSSGLNGQMSLFDLL